MIIARIVVRLVFKAISELGYFKFANFAISSEHAGQLLNGTHSKHMATVALGPKIFLTRTRIQ